MEKNWEFFFLAIWDLVSCLSSLRGTSFPAFLNGTLHWFCKDDERADFIVSFDFGDERFRPIPPPPPYCLKCPFGPIPFIPSSSRCFYANKSKTGIGVLKGSLCLCDASSYDVTDIWVMKDYGVKESWFKEFKIDTSHLDRWPKGLCQPIDVLKSGDLLMYHANNALVSYNGVEFKYFKICEIESKFLAVAHIPSFVSLKDMMGDKVEVLNVSSRHDGSGGDGGNGGDGGRDAKDADIGGCGCRRQQKGWLTRWNDWIQLCGSAHRTQLEDGRTFRSDPETGPYLTTHQNVQISVNPSIPSHGAPPSLSSMPLFLTARVFLQNSTYDFFHFKVVSATDSISLESLSRLSDGTCKRPAPSTQMMKIFARH
ncbi:hypothetical protein L1049_024913 [Liquidambar formosana]|uniref:F-box associated beta-propeller type 1 domain-containing protein n=1 Tax=Liquidambar formosana TaxID=63359 RepID=A0AAP0WYU0_LIQFO